MFSFDQHVEGFFKTKMLKGLIPGIQDFQFSPIIGSINCVFPNIKRLGKQTEFVFTQVLNHSTQVALIDSNIQLINKEKRTIGEVDYLLKKDNEQIHLELAVKFYLFDPKLNGELKDQWIGPNRKDFLHLKISKLKDRQFPILKSEEFHNYCALKEINNNFNPALLLKAQLFLPYNQKPKLPPNYSDCIVGYWVSNSEFKNLPESSNFFIPNKQDWLIEPDQNKEWKNKEDLKILITEAHQRQFSPLVWEKTESNNFNKYFVVWWPTKS